MRSAGTICCSLLVASVLLLCCTSASGTVGIPDEDPLGINFMSFSSNNPDATPARLAQIHANLFPQTNYDVELSYASRVPAAFFKPKTNKKDGKPLAAKPFTPEQSDINIKKVRKSCQDILGEAQTKFVNQDFAGAADTINTCTIQLLRTCVRTPVKSDAEKFVKVWASAWFYRGLSRWRMDPSSEPLRATALADLEVALTMDRMNPDYWQVYSSIYASQNDSPNAFLAGLHELAIRLGLTTEEKMAQFCVIPTPSTAAVAPASADTKPKAAEEEPLPFLRCSLSKLVEAVETKLGYLVKGPKARMQLWEIRRVDDAFPKHIQAGIIRCLKALLFHRSKLPSRSEIVRTFGSPSSEWTVGSKLNPGIKLASLNPLPVLLAMFEPEANSLHAEAAIGLFGEGDFVRGLSHSLMDMNIQLYHAVKESSSAEELLVQQHQGITLFHETWTNMLRNSMLLFSAGIETYLTNIARRLLQDRENSVYTLHVLANNCNIAFCGVAPQNMEEKDIAASKYFHTNCSDSLSYDLLSSVLSSCIRTQDLLPILFGESADSHRATFQISNEFGYTPLHHLALYGDVELLKEAVKWDERYPKYQGMTHFGFSALHLASMRGHSEMVRYLLHDLKVKIDWLDYKGRTALDVACLTGLESNYAVARILKADLAGMPEAKQFCQGVVADKFPKHLMYNSTTTPALTKLCFQYGGWNSYLVYNPSITPNPFGCSTDISPTPKLSFVTGEEEVQHAAAQRRMREAKGLPLSGGLDLPADIATVPSTSPLKQLFDETCNIAVMNPPTSYSEFISEIVALQRPVLIKNAVNWRLLEYSETYHAMARSNFLNKYGNVKLSMGSIPYPQTFGLQSKDITLNDFVAYMDRVHAADNEFKTISGAWVDEARFAQLNNRSYIFISIPLGAEDDLKNVDPTSAEALLSLYNVPAWFQPPIKSQEETDASSAEGEKQEQLDPTTHTPLSVRKLQFFLGPRFSGAPAHFHRSALNIQWFGRKKWSLLPPAQAVYSKRGSMNAWMEARKAHNSTQQPLECIQEAGDAIFVPDFWSHATINLEESMGFAAEFLYGATHFSV